MMTRLHIMSDIHLEFGPIEFDLPPKDKTNILILAGDIGVGTGAKDFILKMCDHYDAVIYVFGNHEFYYHQINDVRWRWDEIAQYVYNLYILDNSCAFFEGLRIIGATLWTDTRDPLMQFRLNDYNCILTGTGRLTVEDTYRMNQKHVEGIETYLRMPFEGRTIVVTHHAPIQECVVAKYNGNPLNPCFHNNLNELIKANDIDYWIHGHMHDSINLVYEGTEIICNPRGYKGHCLNMGFRDDLFIEAPYY